MRLSRRFRADEALDPEIEAELAVIDAELAGGPVPQGSEDMARLVQELREERAEPTEAFAAELDRWAASGFRRAERRQVVPSKTDAASRDRFAGFLPRWVIAPAGGLATLAIVVGVAVSTGGLQSGSDDQGLTAPAGAPEEAHPRIRDAVMNQGGAAADEVAPSVVQEDADRTARRALDGGGAGFSGKLSSKDAQAENRRVARAADLTLVSEPAEIRDVAGGVNEVTNRYEGFVVSSSVQSGDGESGRMASHFQLRIPAGNLQDAIAALSELAHVQSRTESTEDITGQFISAQERIEELEAEREGLLTRLSEAQTEEAAEVIRRQINAVNSQLQATRAELESDRQRVRLVPVTVSIVAEEGAGDDGDWGIGEAVEDAGDVLTTAAGVILVAGAVLVPLAIVALLVALVMRTRTARARDRALDE